MTKSLLVVNVLMGLPFLALDSSRAAVGFLFVLNNILVIGFTVAMIVYLYLQPLGSIPELKTLRVVLLVWGAFVIYNNLRGWLPFAPSADYEFVGFAIFLCSLAYLVARRSLQNEEALAAIRNELEIARRIQTSILPEDNATIERRARGCEVRSHVSGCRRLLRFLVVDDKRVGVLIADVSGHGVSAALVASMVKVAIAAQPEHADDPAKVMAGLNSVLAGKLQGQFVTAAYCSSIWRRGPVFIVQRGSRHYCTIAPPNLGAPCSRERSYPRLCAARHL